MEKEQKIKIITLDNVYEKTITVSVSDTQEVINFNKILNEMKNKNFLELDDGLIIDVQRIIKLESLDDEVGRIGF
ncbi:hypothetical protein [Mammaliicoccus sciuri]|uniref:hypothetical protein n=1 Tax=Mammaliicoccus sciuri TaxID=1296 RepID=UPI000E69055F|nr:hypothetical protein [Mammaliicoccus sciuri]RIO11829.1 hypothetical protein BUZ93_12255 [Mammaliicoccus sciuri]RIO16356.1 hypothetical protein BUZ92_12435 [Mammaliicoccus sciuri]